MSLLLLDLCSGSPDHWNQTLLLARALQTAGIFSPGETDAILLACPQDSPLAVAANSLDIPLVELENGKPGPALWWTLRRVLRERRVTLVHTFDPDALFMGALLRRRHSGLRLVHSVQTGYAPKNKLGDWAARQADAMIFSSSALLDQAGSPNIDPARRHVILPARDANRAVSPARRRADGDGRFVLLAVGDLVPAKDMRALLQAMAYLQNMAIDLPPWEVRIIGQGLMFHDLLDNAEKLGVQGRLALLGAQDRACFLPDADAVISACREGEGDVPLMLDAWAFGLPMACSALQAHREVGEDKVSLLLSPPGNPVALAGSMLRLMQEPQTCARLAEGGKQALARFRPERMMEEHAAVYRQMLRDLVRPARVVADPAPPGGGAYG